MSRDKSIETLALGFETLGNLSPQAPRLLNDPYVTYVMDRVVSDEKIDHPERDWRTEMRKHLIEKHKISSGMAELVLDVEERNAQVRLDERGET